MMDQLCAGAVIDRMSVMVSGEGGGSLLSWSSRLLLTFDGALLLKNSVGSRFFLVEKIGSDIF